MKTTMLLLLCMASSMAQAFEEDANIFCGRLKGTNYRHAVTFTCGVNLSYGLSDWFAINAVYLNEGHPENHHRDGFAIQPSLYKDFDDWRVQLSAGPYYSMDTTRQPDGSVLNDRHLGWLSSVALKWQPRQRIWYVGLGYNNVWMPNKLNSNSVVLFLGADMQKDDRSGDSGDGSKSNIGLWVGPGDTTNPGTKVKTAGQLEFGFPINELFSYSIAGLYEGNTTLADRKGVMAQAWYRQEFNDWTLSAGAGPYLERDALRDKRATNLLAVASVRATYKLTRRTHVGLNFNRVISFYNKDADIFMLGIQRAF
jgi:hypothetical protein